MPNATSVQTIAFDSARWEMLKVTSLILYVEFRKSTLATFNSVEYDECLKMLSDSDNLFCTFTAIARVRASRKMPNVTSVRGIAFDSARWEMLEAIDKSVSIIHFWKYRCPESDEFPRTISVREKWRVNSGASGLIMPPSDSSVSSLSSLKIYRRPNFLFSFIVVEMSASSSSHFSLLKIFVVRSSFFFFPT